MTNAFDGAGVVARANAAVKAVADLGGMTKLTAAEQAKYNAILQQGMDIYTARGREAPAALAAEAAAAKQATATATEFSSALGNIPGLLTNIAGSLGIAFSIGGLVSAVKSTVQWGTDLENTATGIGMNTEQLQRLQFAWKTTGASEQAGLNAIQMMLERIGAGTADAAIARLGLNLQRIETLRPDEQFLAITSALAQVTSETDRAALGAEIFGKGWKSIMVSVANGMAAMAAQAPVLADAEVAQLARIQGAFENLKARAEVFFGASVAGIADIAAEIDKHPALQRLMAAAQAGAQAGPGGVGLPGYLIRQAVPESRTLYHDRRRPGPADAAQHGDGRGDQERTRLVGLRGLGPDGGRGPTWPPSIALPRRSRGGIRPSRTPLRRCAPRSPA